MKKLFIIVLLLAIMPLTAEARVFVGVGVGVGGYYPAPVYPAYYPAYPAYPYYPPAAPVVVQQDPYGAYARPAASPVAYDNGYCREFTQTIHVNGVPQKAYGTSCRQPDGTWRVVTPAQ